MVALTSQVVRFPQIPGASLEIVDHSDSEDVSTAITKQADHLADHVRFQNSLTSQTLVVRLNDAKAAHGRLSIKNKVVLNQAHGIRFLNRYLRLNQHYRAQKNEVTDWMTGDDGPFQLPPQEALARPDLTHPFLIILKNGFNFYHFIDDVLRQFSTIDILGPEFSGEIVISAPKEPLSAFIESFIAAIFPQYAKRLRIVRGEISFDTVLTSYDTNLYAMSGHARVAMPGLPNALPSKGIVKGFNPIANLVRTHRANITSDAYEGLRRAGLERCADVNIPTAGKLFIERGATARTREAGGYGALKNALLEQGFTPVVLEDHTPLEQIKLVSGADTVVGFHGAGFSHLLFAKEHASWIEIGTMQSLRERWPDFWHLADIPGVRYRKYCFDYAKDDPYEYPNFAKESIVPPRITPPGLARLASDLETMTTAPVRSEERVAFFPSPHATTSDNETDRPLRSKGASPDSIAPHSFSFRPPHMKCATTEDTARGFEGRLAVSSNAVLLPGNAETGQKRQVYCPSSHRILYEDVSIADRKPAEDFDISQFDVVKKAGTYVFGGFVRVHFGHFLVECLGPLWTLDVIDEPVDGVLFMPYHANPNETSRNIRLLDDHSSRWLKALGVDEPTEIIRQPTQVDRLILGENGLGLSERFRGSSWFQDFARKRCAHYRRSTAKDANTSIYITRTKLSGRKGGILGETALEDTFRNAGYRIFAPEKHSLEDQLATYAAATRIVAVEGSALHLPPFVIDNTCRIAVLSRRSGVDKIASEFGEQYSGFVDIDLDIIDTAKDHWVPAGQPRTNLESFAVVDFDETYDRLISLGYRPANVPKFIPTPLDVTSQIKEIAKARKQHPTVLNWDKDSIN